MNKTQLRTTHEEERCHTSGDDDEGREKSDLVVCQPQLIEPLGKVKHRVEQETAASVLTHSAKPIYITHKPGSRHCHLANRCKLSFNVLNYVFILFIFNLYCLVNIQQPYHSSSSCD